MSTTMSSTGDRTGRTPDLPPRVANRYGYFTADGAEFCITDPRTPRPWSNIIANPRMGLAVSQTGSGFTWIDNSQLAVITRWEQDLARDSSGKFIYVRDVDSGEIWSLSPAPAWPAFDEYACHHGLGYTRFRTRFADITAEWTVGVHASDPAELWHVELTNHGPRARRLEVCVYLEWCCGVAPSPRREFHKLFIETAYDADRGAIYAWNHMWDVPGGQYGHWNKDFPYVSVLAATDPVLSAQGDKAEFFGRYGDPKAPAALNQDRWNPCFGRHDDPVAALRSVVVLQPNASRRLGYVLAAEASRAQVDRLVDRLCDVDAIVAAQQQAVQGWRDRLADQRIDTPDDAVNYLTNDWLRYQAISGRIWGRAGYYQQSGAYGFRDQLQDSQVWLTIDPALCRQQINLHAAHQFADGSVYHWWHPLSEQGLITTMTDDLLWLAFVTANYIKETGHYDVLDDAAPFLDDDQPAPVAEHVRRAFERVFQRTSPRGLPYIGAGDWNDGLSAAGLQEKGESIWLGHFLAGLLADWADIHRARGDQKTADDLAARRRRLVDALNTHGWDGQWYLRATLDDGAKLGSAENRVGRIFLNAQTWAVLNDVADADRAQVCMDAVREHLVSTSGALLLAPAFDAPQETIGYITRYAPGLRENGGVYSHAATWAIAAACKIKDERLVDQLLRAATPAHQDPDCYWAEPYVTPGNIDGPDSPHCGRGGWTWYTGSASWLHRVITQWVLGVRPEWDGLRIDPCLPPHWDGARMTRPYRGSQFEFIFERRSPQSSGGVEVMLDGKRLPDNLIPANAADGQPHQVTVRC